MRPKLNGTTTQACWT
uniref:Uncharacterized protein n=1 Tax=Anguilla anguilla TaxID=7936 RepID=A0A0E9RN77_ANGAN